MNLFLLSLWQPNQNAFDLLCVMIKQLALKFKLIPLQEEM